MNRSLARKIVLGTLICSLGSLCAPAWAEECVPEGMTTPATDIAVPDLFPSAIPLPEGHSLISASAGAADDYNPYPFAMLEFMAPGSKDALFDYYQEALPAAGYRIVMWEKDDGATGLRVRGDDIDQASFSFNDYDCQAYVSVSVSLLP